MESDTDCGGEFCPPCPDTWEFATCNDKVWNGNETDKDCGGGTCPKCAVICSLSSFTNGDFETGTSSGWTIGGGSRAGIDSSLINPSDYLLGGSRYVANIATSHSSIVTNGTDPNIKTLMPNIVHR
ncbi:unnamed protein product, partial [Rotaria sordida]